MKSYKNNSLLLISLTLLLYYSPSWANAFSVEQTVKYALGHSPKLDQFRQTQQISQLQVGNARAKFLPSLDITSQHTVGQVGGNSSNTNNGFGIRATELLYDNGQSLLGFEKAKLQRKTSDVNYLQARDGLVLDVMINVLDLSLNKRLYKIQQNNLDLLQQQYQQALQEYKNGLRTEEDVVRFRNNVNNAQIGLLNADIAIKQAKNQLLALIGLSPHQAQQQNINFTLFDIQDKKLAHRKFPLPTMEVQYEYQLRELQRDINRVDIRSAKRDYWPNVVLNAEAGYGNTLALSNGFVSGFGGAKQFDWALMLNFSYNLWDWGTRRNNVSIAKHESRSKIDGLTAQLNDRSVVIYNTQLNLVQLQDVYKISEELLQSEKENYARIQQNYREGKLSFLDLISAINTLTSADREYIRARYNLAKEFYRYQDNQGTIYATIFH